MSQLRKLTLEEKILSPFLPGLGESATFQSVTRPALLPLSYPRSPCTSVMTEMKTQGECVAD